ncbi:MULTISPECIES: ABC transporter permease [Shewanella]|uniref:Copper ABC transporter permease n=1 Tax=Shewanella psychromarinicola TaxID=2487742 RepID=A0A3N4EWG8_9GAMM|nr:ABC transporter permease subunit [Shewanella psychromarinicola]AZG34844.1 copper ABC transporter permease [Shewanella psychromarinicola]MCL1082933.1 ABC transporter permease [Shewanella psychromarinicola]RPA33364.1 copper ABC transporter permease [Shewanella psychromarinicola]
MFTAVLAIALKEIKDNFRNRWFLFIGLMLTCLSLLITFAGSAVSGELVVADLPLLMTSLSSMCVYILPLTAILLSYDSFIGEEESGTLLLLLSYPVTRLHIILGKLLGHLWVFSCTIGWAFFLTAILVWTLTAFPIQEVVVAFIHLILSSILLTVCFVLLGYIVSLLVVEKAKAIAVLLFLWVMIVLVYDLVLLTFMVADLQGFSNAIFQVLILLNPSDLFRAIMSGVVLPDIPPQGDVVQHRGSNSMLSIAQMPIAGLYSGLLLWVSFLLIVGQQIFSRKRL